VLKVENLRKRYVTEDGTPGGGVFGASFEVAEGEMFTLLGPSGCGKTTTLRAIAGLEVPDSGRVTLAGEDIYSSDKGLAVPPYERDIGMVFQSYAIWPHMSVAENAAYPLKVSRRKRLSRAAIDDKVRKVLRMVGMEEFHDRPATQLSGGQQQRLALARALTREPKLLLLDEPLSNLDAQLREQMRGELQRLQKESGVTSIYVTHDQSEALALSDRIAVMNKGLIVQLGTPKDIYQRPTSEFVASFIGKTNLLPGEVVCDTRAETAAKVATPLGEVVAFFRTAVASRRRIAVVIRPENIEILADAQAGENRFAGRIEREVYLGEIVEYTVGFERGVSITVRTRAGQATKVGDMVTLRLPPERTIALIEGAG
jgi:iron(III) transport system ATP-binding protein